MYPQGEASGGWELYYIRLSWHLVILWVRLTFSQLYLLGRGISWPWMVLSQVILTFVHHLGQADIQSDVPQVEASGAKSSTTSGYPDIWVSFGLGWHSGRCTSLVEASGGQEWYYIKSYWYLVIGCEADIQSNITFCRGISWPRMVLNQVILTFVHPLGQADIQLDVPPVEAISCQG